MREIIFRGKRVDNGEWVYGYYDVFRYHEDAPPIYLIHTNGWTNSVEIEPGTVGQYTGLTDKNGKKIFEGDIVKTWKNNIGKIEFGQYWDEETEEDFYGYAWIGKDEYEESITLSLNNCWNGHEVIGNLHDNPELLKVKE